MLFNSYEYIFFLVFVFLVNYQLREKQNLNNIFLLICSYIFYSFWDYRFLALIILSTFFNFNIALYIKKSPKKKYFLYTSIVFNLLVLVFFKYYNFFLDTFFDFLKIAGYENYNFTPLNIILPVGISFYTFQTLSYTIDVYKNEIEPTKDYIVFSTFVSFFPQLIAGPIERSKRFLPLLLAKRNFSSTRLMSGFRMVVIGLFKKIVIADNLAPKVNFIFENYETINPFLLLLGAVYFSVQIYCDFSGYSDIAIGSSRLLGLDLMTNFNFPYLSKNIKEFWNRWHISLSSWFRDYVYFNLGGSRKNYMITSRNILIVFLLSGLWHGANMTFVVWGLLHSIYYTLFKIFTNYLSINSKNCVIGSVYVLFNFIVISAFWIFFRSENLDQAINIFSILFNDWDFSYINFDFHLIYIFIYLLFDLSFSKFPKYDYRINLFDYIVLPILLLTVIKFIGNHNDFIYFQF